VATVLIVDDNPLDRKLAGGLVEKVGMATKYAENGLEALAIIERDPPDIVLTDIVMPELDGLELVRRIKADNKGLPVVLMTAHGSEEIAAKALQIGASNYIPKQNLGRDLAHTLRDVLMVVTAKRDETRALNCLTVADLEFVLRVAEPGLHEPLVGYLQQQLRNWSLCDEADLIRVGTALHEAFINAIEHGNLELKSDLRDRPDGAYQQLSEHRRKHPPFCRRHVYVRARLSRDDAVITIRDEGPGFDPRCLPDPTDPENIGKISGRGLLLIRTFMDEVRFNPSGNEITLIKRRSPSAPRAS
jgi:CheY-like chemotaxis protein